LNLSQFLAKDLGIVNGKKLECSILEPIKDNLYIFNFETVIKDINEHNKEMDLEKPKNIKEKNLGKISELLKNLDIEAELDIEYNALGVPHSQKGKTYKILSNGLSLFTAIPPADLELNGLSSLFWEIKKAVKFKFLQN